MPTSTSNLVIRMSLAASTMDTNGSISRNVCTYRSGLTGAPSMAIRSVTSCRCGLVNRPTRRPIRVSRASIMRAVEVLPVVPGICTTGYDRRGLPSTALRALIRSSDAPILVSGQRVSRSAHTSRETSSTARAVRLAGRGPAGRDDVTARVEAEPAETRVAQHRRRTVHRPALHHGARIERAARQPRLEGTAGPLFVLVTQRDDLLEIRAEFAG